MNYTGKSSHHTKAHRIPFIRLNHNTGRSAAMSSGTQYMLQKNSCTRFAFCFCIWYPGSHNRTKRVWNHVKKFQLETDAGAAEGRHWTGAIGLLAMLSRLGTSPDLASAKPFGKHGQTRAAAGLRPGAEPQVVPRSTPSTFSLCLCKMCVRGSKKVQKDGADWIREEHPEVQGWANRQNLLKTWLHSTDCPRLVTQEEEEERGKNATRRSCRHVHLVPLKKKG